MSVACALDEGRWQKHLAKSKNRKNLKDRALVLVHELKKVVILFGIGIVLWLLIGVVPMIFPVIYQTGYFVVMVGYFIFNLFRL